MNDFPAVLLFGVLVLLWVPRLGWSPGVGRDRGAFGRGRLHGDGEFVRAGPGKVGFATAAAIVGYWLKPGAR